MLAGACSRISRSADVGARAFACVHKPAIAQSVECLFVDVGPLALANDRLVGGEAQPLEIFQDRGFEHFAASLPIVILDSHQHAAAVTGLACRFPHVHRAEHVTEMKKAGGSRRETGDDGVGDGVQRGFFV